MDQIKPLQHTLDQVLLQLKQLQRPVVELLQPGLSPEEIQLKTQSLPFQLPEELKQLYSWRNGVPAQIDSPPTDLQLFPGFFLLSLQEALNMWEWCQQHKIFPPAKDWLPIFADGAGNLYTAECSREPATLAPIVGYIDGEYQHEVEYESLHAMALTLSTAYQKKAIFIENDMLKFDDDSYEAIVLQFNPNTPLSLAYRQARLDGHAAANRFAEQD